MVADYPISIRSLGHRFEPARVKASDLANFFGCQFWWKPENDDWHLFVFTDHKVANAFIGYLQSHVVGTDVTRINAVFVLPEEVRKFADHCVYIRSVYTYARRLFSESTPAEREAMESVAPSFLKILGWCFRNSWSWPLAE